MLRTVVMMGVSGSGKSYIGAKLAQALGGVFEDADDFHPQSNIEKMAHGVPLTDGDRWPWLHSLRQQIILYRRSVDYYVLSCSALKQRYRDTLRGNDSTDTLRFVYLKGTPDLLRQRMAARQHFMPSTLLESQLAILEEPQEALTVDIRSAPDQIVRVILDSVRSMEFTQAVVAPKSLHLKNCIPQNRIPQKQQPKNLP